MPEKIYPDSSSSLPGDGECPTDLRVVSLINQLRKANGQLPFPQVLFLSVAAISSRDARIKELSPETGL